MKGYIKGGFMSVIVIKCKTTTPTFCYGADGVTPELRAPSLKGALRFWWRAIYPDLSLDKLKENETNIFGGTGGDEESKAIRSSFSFRIINPNLRIDKYRPLPHHDDSSYCNNCEKRNGKCIKSYKKDAFMESSTFEIIIRPKKEEIKNLLLLTSILDGIGARSRRGFGCFQIEAINDEKFNFELSEDNITKLIRSINPNFEISKDYNRNYPYLQKVEIGKPHSDYNEILKNIGKASHEFDTPYTGTARNGRYASPVYVSIYKQNDKYYPIISTLKRTINDISYAEEKKNNFIKAILGGE